METKAKAPAAQTTQSQIQSFTPDDVANIVRAAVETALNTAKQNENKLEKTIKFVGRSGDKSKKYEKYVSIARSAMYYIADSTVIIFSDYTFETNDEEHIEFLNDHPELNISFFYKEYPETVLKKFKEDRELLSKTRHEPEIDH